MTHGQKLKNTFGRFIGVSLTMQELYRQIEKFAVSDAPVLITGESGTGKEICAQSFHSYSDRNHQPFIPLNCAGLDGHMADSALFGHVKGAFTGGHRTRKGAIARAQGGTLFLDEVFDMPLLTQAKLLRFCQDYSYRKLGCDRLEQADIRLICATNKNLKKNLKANRFREDLYYRLNTIPVHMPPLRERGEDVLDIAHFYLHEYAKAQNKAFCDFSHQAQECLLRYPWPGNIRELQNILQYVVSGNEGQIITADMLPGIITKNAFLPEENVQPEKTKAILPLWQIEKNVIENAIHLCNGNITEAATLLDIAPSTIYRKKQSWEENG